MPENSQDPHTPAPGLPSGYRLLKQEEAHDRIHYTVECVDVPHHCPYCLGRPAAWGSKTRDFIDFPRAGRRVVYTVQIRRLRCTQCGKTFLQDLPALNHNHGMTRRLFVWAGQECTTKTFGEVGASLGSGMEDTSVRALFNNYMKELQLVFAITPPEALALLPLKLVSKPSTAVINVVARTLVDVIQGQAVSDLQAKLEELAAAGKTKTVALGFNAAYRDAVKAFLPTATPYIDPFFVLDMADRGVDSARKAVRASVAPAERRLLAHDAELLSLSPKGLTDKDEATLVSWFKQYPLLREAYGAREALRKVYKIPRAPDEGYSALIAAMEDASPGAQVHFRELQKALAAWKEEVSAYFSVGSLNTSLVRIEGLNQLEAWLAASNGRGGVFEVARAALLYPPGIPARTSRSPGTGLERLKRQAGNAAAAARAAAPQEGATE